MTYAVFLISDVVLGIASAITAIERASTGDTGWMWFFIFLTGVSFLIAYFLVKD